MKKLFMGILALASMTSALAQMSDLPKQTNRTNFRVSLFGGATADRLLLHSNVPGPYILRVCVSKAKKFEYYYSESAMISYRLDNKEIISGEYVDRLTNTDKKSDFAFCHDEEFSSAEELNGKKIKITAIGAGRDIFAQTIPKNKPSLTWPVLIQTDKFPGDINKTYVVLEVFNPKN
jgi:hypothetical protein